MADRFWTNKYSVGEVVYVTSRTGMKHAFIWIKGTVVQKEETFMVVEYMDAEYPIQLKTVCNYAFRVLKI